MRCRRMICFCLGLWMSSTATARDVFVDNKGGNDSQNGGSPVSEGRNSGPVRTLTKALRVARSGDRIVIAETDEPFREQVTIQGGNNSGESYLPLIIEGNGAVLDGSMAIPDDAWQSLGGGLFRFDPPYKSSQMLWLDGALAQRIPHEPNAAKQPVLEPKQWMLVGGGIILRVEPNRIPSSYSPRCAGFQTGITLYEARHVVLRDLTVRGFALDGVNAHDGVVESRFERVTSEENGRSGFSIGGASRIRLEQCAATNNGAAQLRTEGYSSTTLRECKLDATHDNAVVNDGGKVIEDKLERTKDE